MSFSKIKKFFFSKIKKWMDGYPSTTNMIMDEFDEFYF